MKRLTFLFALTLTLAHPGRAEQMPAKDPAAQAPWKTYTNTRYGFEFQYPATLQIREHFKSETTTVFSRDINTGLFAVAPLKKGQYMGFSVVVVKKSALLFRSKALPGFYKYEPTLNTWLGYNFVSAEYDKPLQ